MGKNVKRLYEQFRPENYNLGIDLDHGNFKFSGKVVITGQKTGRPSQRITLHQKDLKISSAAITHHGKETEEIAISRVNSHAGHDEVRLHTEKLLYPGKYTVELEFSGKITDVMHGLYPCYYKKDGEKQHLLATQFESHYAREVFPCIDEPEAKAIFTLSLSGPKDMTFLSNTPEKSNAVKGDQRAVSFEPTPSMSTYLLAFVVGEMHCVEAKTKDGITLRTWASIAQPKRFLEFANKEAVDILEFYQDYFQTPYP
ncbi:MAG TPA: aminopeptidase, partial [Patescibacteria group bacterium]|nr:aminopeptidase [Patescibacteria group bacterium]